MHSSELLMFLAFDITYSIENEELWELQRHLLNPKPSWEQSFSCCFAIRTEMTPSTDFIQSMHFSTDLLQTNFMISLFL